MRTHHDGARIIRSTTILSVRRGAAVAIGGDGQVSLGPNAVKHNANKIHRLADGNVIAGFAGGAADAFALLERLDTKLEHFKGNLRRAAVELARDWRTDRVLRRLESMIIACSRETTLMISGSGDVIEPDDGVLGIGSGGAIATGAARALLRHTEMPPAGIVESALNIAADLCVYTNHKITVEAIA
ncbi:MAG: ATP-dependent protease subunit HslV [Phycisphaerae bacterium]|nr:MAG: ATP-dependent protease subunit HslV [Planctomycetota bacterium]KAB2947627.1 MAG: ATP-dependent protease subunit HslV [Phycisphaerae bacterium]MBE7455733.1 ATP-dependent protease subunit HslV [Planctomycetia bacterium]MCK6463369.1 ATP-dependent protease subunit HslV [Phycisphaerae bacterium]MCL4716991.1 ATP-dependent protease subunit HslV [Phycisphaerae bacterium]